MKKIIYFISLLSLTNITYSQVLNQESNNKQLSIRFDDLEKENKQYSKLLSENEIHIRDLSNTIELLNKRNDQNQIMINDLTKDISNLKNSYLHNLFSASIGSIILLIGLLIEIIGATLLAGNNLSSEIKTVYSLSIKADLSDLATSSIMREDVMKFHGYIGSFLLIVGFLLQMTGTISVIGVPLSMD